MEINPRLARDWGKGHTIWRRRPGQIARLVRVTAYCGLADTREAATSRLADASVHLISPFPSDTATARGASAERGRKIASCFRIVTRNSDPKRRRRSAPGDGAFVQDLVQRES